MLQFTFNEKVLYAARDASFPASKEKLGWWMGVAENKGGALTYWILTEDGQLLARSLVRPLKASEKNKRVENETDGSDSHSNGLEGRQEPTVQLDLHSELQKARPVNFDPTTTLGISFVREDSRNIPTKTTVMEVDEETGRVLLEYTHGDLEWVQLNVIQEALITQSEETNRSLHLFKRILDHRSGSYGRTEV